MADRRRHRPSHLTSDRDVPGAFPGETVTRRRLMTGSAHVTGAVAASAFTLPVLGFALAPVFESAHASWQGVGKPGDFSKDDYRYGVITIAQGVGEAGHSTVFVRRRNPQIDKEPGDRWNQFIAISSRCAHVGCPVRWTQAAAAFICPCHGGVYDIRGLRIGGPPPRPLDRFYTRVHEGQVEIGPRYSVNGELRRFSPRDPGESLDGIGQGLYPARPTTAKRPR